MENADISIPLQCFDKGFLGSLIILYFVKNKYVCIGKISSIQWLKPSVIIKVHLIACLCHTATANISKLIGCMLISFDSRISNIVSNDLCDMSREND